MRTVTRNLRKLLYYLFGGGIGVGPAQATVHWTFLLALALSLSLSIAAIGSSYAAEPAAPTPPIQVAQQTSAPDGFRVELFASEPDVVQPVAMTFDDRGRLWVVEMLTYADLQTNFDLTFRDRIVVLEDADGDGRMDRRKVFWDQGQRVTSVEVGFGGVFVLAAPQMLFIPDGNQDDVPDGDPEVLLEGWDAGPVRHNIVNGLKWGPDGWLYGRHGIQATSNVGKPGAPDKERTRLNCCIWRFHPTRRVFEVVCQGGTNSWGHDWDQFGNLWFINTVIGHLWQGIPGAWFKRMYGEHLESRRYQLIDQHADHYHWDTARSWSDSRDGAHGSDALGGGHAHSGLMIYQGDNWPELLRNELFTLNFHGRRINREHLERHGSGWIGRHRPDLVKFHDPWFRGIDLAYGPDGGVFVLDWSDTGECHENDADGVHRETGRIFKVTHGTPRRPWIGDVSKMTDSELVQLQLHANEWFARHGRRVLQERAATGKNLAPAHAELKAMFDQQPGVPEKLRALWTLHATGGADREWLVGLLIQPDEHVRAWAVTLLADSGELTEPTIQQFVDLAERERVSLVRLSLASALRRIDLPDRPRLARALLEHGHDSTDHNLPLVIWYGIEPALSAGVPNAMELYANARIPLVRQLIVRRIAEELDRTPADLEAVLEWATRQESVDVYRDVIRGLAEALRGWRKAPKPVAWGDFAEKAARVADPEVQDRLRDLNLLFGNGLALSEVRQLAMNASANGEARRTAVRQLIEARVEDLDALLEKLILDQVTGGAAARGLARSSDPEARAVVFRHFKKLSHEDQAAVVGQLVTRERSAAELLEGVGKGIVSRQLINAMHARQILGHGNLELNQRLVEFWGEIRATEDDKRALITRYKGLLVPERLATADLRRGRSLFDKACAVCHRLYGEGNEVGPDLTGSGRANLDYLLENLVDPSAMVPEDYRVSNVELADGRSLSGVVVATSGRTIELQTQNERLVIDRGEIVELRRGTLSLMPDGLLEMLNEDEIRDLIAYLMHPQQVPRTEEDSW